MDNLPVSYTHLDVYKRQALEVRESNLGARNLYDSYGFRQEAVRKGYYHNPAEDAIIMWNRAI